ncbi:MAG: PEP-CTERM sorting domain-containing protein [Gammaproteobacteria bacterium]|nr:PEP-CTERM sorting domain-containing protein [Gammaproteobacteria bacterium]
MTIFNRALTSTLGLLFIVVSFNANAVPSLQLDIIGGTYDTGDETIVGDGDLVAYGKVRNDGDNSTDYIKSAIDLTSDYQISLALYRLDGTSILSSDSGFGSFGFGGTTYSVGNGNLVHGSPPATESPDTSSEDLQNHGIFPTFYGTYDFDWIDTQTRSSVNTQDTTGTDPNDFSSGADLVYMTFSWDIAGLTDGYGLHFDLYEVLADGSRGIFAPFSHDAASSIPEPGPLALLGMGLIMVFLSARRRRV